MSKGVTPVLFQTVNVRAASRAVGVRGEVISGKEYPDGNDWYGQVLQR